MHRLANGGGVSRSTQEEDLTVDGLTRDWKIVQRRRGHRHSTDDLLTGWYAIEQRPDPSTILDLGSGIGTVGLLALWRAPGATLTAVEAQEVSFGLLQRNIELNGLGERVRAIHGDLRQVRLPGETFDLVTGSPPYFDVKDGVVPADSQKAHARFELRGDVRDYCHAARAALSPVPSSRFVFCFPTVQRERAERACVEAGLQLVASRDVVPRAGAAPLFTLYSCRLPLEGEELTAAHPRGPDYLVRDAGGEQTAEHLASRASFGFGFRNA